MMVYYRRTQILRFEVLSSPPRSHAVLKLERSKAVATAVPVTLAMLCMAFMNLSLTSRLL